MDGNWQADLEGWLAPFAAALRHKTRSRMCPAYVAGLIGPGDRKSIQPMAARDRGVSYDQLHHFIGSGVWDAAPLGAALHRRSRQIGWRRQRLVDHRRHCAAEEGTSLGWRCATIRFRAWQDSKLSIPGLGDAGIARSAGDGWTAAVSARDLDERSQAHDAGPCAEGSADPSDKTGNRDRRDRPCHRLRRAFWLCACRIQDMDQVVLSARL